MVRHCYVCKIYSHQTLGQQISFHRFPANLERRNLWISALGYQEGHQFPKLVEICSNHFKQNDFEYRDDGSKYLKREAVPVPVHSVFNPLERTSSDSSINSSPSKKQLKSTSSGADTESDDDIITIASSSFEVSPPRKRLITEEDILSIPGPSSRLSPCLGTDRGIGPELNITTGASIESSSTTLTASETEDVVIKEDDTNEAEIVCASTPQLRKDRSSSQKKRKRRYVGDLSSDDFSTPTKAKKNFRFLKNIIVIQRRKIRSLQTTVGSLRKRIKTLNSLLHFFKNKSYITDSSQSVIKASLRGYPLKIFERMLKGPSTQKYNPTIRSFALTLAFYSPKAYSFVRNTFNRSLPHLSTINKWYASIDGSPGFTKEALVALKIKQKEALSKGKTLLCNLVLDEMSIRQQVEWTGSKFCGYVDIGSKIHSDTLPEAKEALVFMLVCLNGYWKIPVVYFFLDGLAAPEKGELVKKCLEFVHESAVIVTSVTFDGAPVNFTMASYLGADFRDLKELKPRFRHPVTGDNVFIFLDPCHMIKLVRNTFGSQKYITDINNKLIDWNFIEKLVDIQYFEGLHLGTKIRNRHLQWAREKMKVKIATQTLSKSVADALLYLDKDLKLSEFENVEATANFVKKFNDLFDIFNSRNRFAKYFYKRPLSPATADSFFQFLDEMTNYISGLKLGNVPILQSGKKTGFFGFLICINSLKGIYRTYVLEQKILKYILSIKISQDHLELFFGAIRAKGGFNNNPTARQFEAAYKRLLVHTEITGPDTGNITNSEKLTILSCGSGHQVTINDYGDDMLESENYLDFQQVVKNNIEKYQFSSIAWNLTIYLEDIVAYIAGFVVKCLNKCVTCLKCKNLLETEDVLSPLQQRKQYGNLIKASEGVVNVCKAAEKYFKFFMKTTNIFNKNIKNLKSILIKNTFETLSSEVLNFFEQHLYDDDPVDGHVFYLIKLILDSYFNLRIHHETVKNLDFSKKDRIRSTFTKRILFSHQ